MSVSQIVAVPVVEHKPSETCGQIVEHKQDVRQRFDHFPVTPFLVTWSGCYQPAPVRIVMLILIGCRQSLVDGGASDSKCMYGQGRHWGPPMPQIQMCCFVADSWLPEQLSLFVWNNVHAMFTFIIFICNAIFIGPRYPWSDLLVRFSLSHSLQDVLQT